MSNPCQTLGKIGHSSVTCKICHAHYDLNYRIKHREKRVKQSKDWYWNNRKKSLADSHKWKLNNPEKRNQQDKLYRSRHPEKVRERHRLYCLKYPEKRAATLRAWEQKNKIYRRAYNKKLQQFLRTTLSDSFVRRLLFRGKPYGHISQSITKNLIEAKRAQLLLDRTLKNLKQTQNQ